LESFGTSGLQCCTPWQHVYLHCEVQSVSLVSRCSHWPSGSTPCLTRQIQLNCIKTLSSYNTLATKETRTSSIYTWTHLKIGIPKTLSWSNLHAPAPPEIISMLIFVHVEDMLMCLILSTHQTRGVGSLLGGRPQCIEIPYSVQLFSRNQYSRFSGWLKKGTYCGIYSENHAVSRYHWIFDASTLKIPWFFETAGFSESHCSKIPELTRPKIPWFFKTAGFSASCCSKFRDFWIDVESHKIQRDHYFDDCNDQLEQDHLHIVTSYLTSTIATNSYAL
jgi:hypothetical protein